MSAKQPILHDDPTEQELAESAADKLSREAAREERTRLAGSKRMAALAKLTAGGPVLSQPMLRHLLTECLPDANGFLLFDMGDHSPVALSGRTMRRLRDLKRDDLHGWVDRHGVHIRSTSGMLRLRLNQLGQLDALTRKRKPWPKDVECVTFAALEVAA